MDNEKFTTYASLIFIELSFTSKKFVKELEDQYKELHEIISKLVATPSKENQEHLENLYTHNEESLKKYVHAYLLKNENEFNWTTFLNKYEVTRVAGKFFKIEKTNEAYAKFVNTMREERWVFSFMSVAAEDDCYTIFFA